LFRADDSSFRLSQRYCGVMLMEQAGLRL